MQWIRDLAPRPEQTRQYRTAMIVTLGGNLLLAVSKGVVAWLSGSAAIYSDAANSVSDVIYSLLMVLGLWVATRPPDLSHPQGHARFEPLVGMAVSAAMAFAGFEAARNALERYREANLAPITLDLPTLVLLASAAIKGGMYFWIKKISLELHSPTLNTTARDNLSDVLTSLAAFLGVLGSNLIHPLADPIAGIIVAAWIFRQVYIAARENLGFLTGKGATQEELQVLAATAEAVPGVVAASPFILNPLMLRTPQRQARGVMVRGIDPEGERRATSLAKFLKQGDLLASGPGILVGKALARELGLVVGDEVKLISPVEVDTPAGPVPIVLDRVIAGIFNAGMSDYDSNLIYADLATAQKLYRFGDGVHGVSVKIRDLYDTDRIQGELRKAFPFPCIVKSWMEQNPTLFAAVNMEKKVMFIIVTLIVLVAALNIASRSA